ncbi:hypothetical protein M3Y99_01695200 [Aphelenchoides fujianensis]|nr:hypothetical protein M3Y99_01695200 [Aphelenchoides fujianensis]
MGFKDAFISMVGDFVQANKNPEFRSKSDLSTASGTKSNDANPRPFSRVRRHSLNITVGTDSPAEQAVRQRTFSVRTAPARRNTILPEATPRKPEAAAEEPLGAYRTARRFSEPFNARLPETPAVPAVVVRRPKNLTVERETDSDGTESDSSSTRQTPATSPRVFQTSFEKRNTRFFPAAPTSWRNSVLLDEQPIAEECEVEAESPESEHPVRKATVIKITASPCS